MRRIEEEIALQVEAIEHCQAYLQDAEENREAAPWLFDEEAIAFAHGQIEFCLSRIEELKAGR